MSSFENVYSFFNIDLLNIINCFVPGTEHSVAQDIVWLKAFTKSVAVLSNRMVLDDENAFVYTV